MHNLDTLGQTALTACQELALLPTQTKNQALRAMALALRERKQDLLSANTLDLETGREMGLTESLLDRLKLNPHRVEAMATGLEEIARLPDPVGTVVRGWRHDNGIEIRQVRVPLGLIGVIYEARPNVTADAIGLCLKSGNGVMLKGGKEAEHSNQAISQLLQQAAYAQGIPTGCIQQVPGTDRAIVEQLITLRHLALVIPRGGAGLIKFVTENSTVPVLETGVGNCHIYIAASADPDQAQKIVLNAKVQRPSVCNACEKVLIHQSAVAQLPALVQVLQQSGVQVRGCERTVALVPSVIPATAADWDTEYLDLILAIKIVDSTPVAIDWINRYGTQHSEAILTGSYGEAQLFTQRVDAACVYVNASTRFTDGFEFGFGAEIGISTQKLHARGPVGLPELTTTKYILQGNGQIRP
ncbi:glutamate-5-semialdehyde dehydrogenase [Candidatus Cyanaurora vandensis]|uniref:glutamate-5-semialdehyde dehydrogenase n=1 Tax=Candidatus Cyanaurora vandensis TaxID=2714958 RepID=UPI00257E8703|nr:glutamate-5-semialdehyde dehydrogenase [Candidatus Cyanaurora vandensis]